jgi:hypothetical protein
MNDDTTTGSSVVDAAVRRLDELESLDLPSQVAVFEGIHQTLVTLLEPADALPAGSPEPADAPPVEA